MKEIVIYYQSGKIESHVEPFVSDLPPGLKAIRFNLRLDLLQSEGLLVEIVLSKATYEGPAITSVEAQKNIIWTHTQQEAYARNRLVSQAELYDISKIVVDGEIVVWRQGDQLINGVLFYANELLYFSDENTASINSKIVELFSYLKNANPDLDDKYIVERLGLTMLAFTQIMSDEQRNLARKLDNGVDLGDMLAVPPSVHAEDTPSAPLALKSQSQAESTAQTEEPDDVDKDALDIFNDYISEFDLTTTLTTSE